jgi:hypothetical protein
METHKTRSTKHLLTILVQDGQCQLEKYVHLLIIFSFRDVRTPNVVVANLPQEAMMCL